MNSKSSRVDLAATGYSTDLLSLSKSQYVNNTRLGIKGGFAPSKNIGGGREHYSPPSPPRDPPPSSYAYGV